MAFSKETQDSLGELMGSLKHFSELLERVSYHLRGVSSNYANMLEQMSDTLKSLNNPDKFDSLEHFNQVLKSEMDNIGQGLARYDWVTDNIRDNFMKLNKYVMPEFEKNVLREQGQNIGIEPRKSEPAFQKPTEQKVGKPVNVVPKLEKHVLQEPSLEKKQEAKDVSQKPLDVMVREDGGQDKVNEKSQSNKEVIEKLKAVVNMFDPKHSDESFKKMIFALKDVSESKLVPNKMVDSYRHIFNEVKEHRRNTEVGIFDLSTEIYNQIADLESADKEIAALNKVQDFVKHYSDVYQNSNPSQIVAELNKLRYVYNKDGFRSFNSDTVSSQINGMIDKLLTNLKDKEIQQKTIEDLMNLTNKQKESLNEKYYPKTKEEKNQQNQDVFQKPQDLMVREDARKDEKKRAIEDFKKGTEKVLDIGKQIEQDKQKKLNQSALAEFRRKLLLNRGNGDV